MNKEKYQRSKFPLRTKENFLEYNRLFVKSWIPDSLGWPSRSKGWLTRPWRQLWCGGKRVVRGPQLRDLHSSPSQFPSSQMEVRTRISYWEGRKKFNDGWCHMGNCLMQWKSPSIYHQTNYPRCHGTERLPDQVKRLKSHISFNHFKTQKEIQRE